MNILLIVTLAAGTFKITICMNDSLSHVSTDVRVQLLRSITPNNLKHMLLKLGKMKAKVSLDELSKPQFQDSFEVIVILASVLV